MLDPPEPCGADQVGCAALTHLGVVSHGGIFQQKRVCKKGGVFDLRHCRESLFVASWNVHSLVECVGDARICGVSKTSKPHLNFLVDRKLNLLVKELQRYRVTIAGLQETKWFESDVWPAENGWVFLHAGRPLPSSHEVAQRGEGVGILLSPVAVDAWHAAGDTWCAVSSRIVTARLKLASAGLRHAGGTRCASDLFLTVISVYAPTFRAPRHVKETFWDDLQRYLTRYRTNGVGTMGLILVLLECVQSVQ